MRYGAILSLTNGQSATYLIKKEKAITQPEFEQRIFTRIVGTRCAYCLQNNIELIEIPYTMRDEEIKTLLKQAQRLSQKRVGLSNSKWCLSYL